jgi:hypothetical protein
MSGRSTRKESIPVHNIRKYLEKKGIEYRQEVTFTKCRNKKVLPFDFQIIINGRIGLIEYDGEQHFHIVSRFHRNDEQSKERFEQGVYHDKIKTRYAYDNSISLLRISYREQNQIEPWIDKFVSSFHTKYLIVAPGPIYLFTNKELYREHERIVTPLYCSIQ